MPRPWPSASSLTGQSIATSDDPTGQVPDFLREQFARVNTRLDHLTEGQLNLSHQVSSLEAQVALVHGDFANQSMQADRPN